MRSLLTKLLFVFLVFPLTVICQTNPPTNSAVENQQLPNGCGTDAFLKKARKSASFVAREALMNRQILSEPVTLDAVFTLPVVFHIVAEDPTQVSDLEIQDALKDLNDAFGKTGNYTGSKGVDTKIRFCLANEDPDGGITTGITRTKSFYSKDLNKSIEDARIKNLIQWDPEHYINIWYVNNIQDENFVYWTCGLLDGSQWRRIGTEGYATMPALADSLDGIVVSEFEAVLAHEMGHYLGLYHTFEGGCNNNDCTTSGDMVCDTPPDNSYLPSSCTDPGNSCRTDTLSNYSNGYFPVDVPDPVTNFMDYGNFTCSNEFTNGQAVRMRAAINTQRSGLLENKCNKPCNEYITAAFTRDIPFPLPGDQINFTNNSSGGSKFQWLVNDQPVSTGTNFSYQFADTGKYKVSLKTFNNPGCFAIYTDYIIVTCGVAARFYADKQRIASKLGFVTDSILFTNTSENANSFQWLISNDVGMAENVVNTGKNFLYTFPEPGNYSVRLIASNGTCIDTTESYAVPVLDPTPDASPRLYSVDCYEQTKVRVEFGFCNSGFMPVPGGIPISFFDSDPLKPGAKKIGQTFITTDSVRGSCCSATFTQILDVKKEDLNELYMVFNTEGKLLPVKLGIDLPVERNYNNNIISKTDIAYKVFVTPPSATLEPGDSLHLGATTSTPSISSTFTWSSGDNLSCTNCDAPWLVADSGTTKRVIGISEYDCVDTAFTTIKVPPAYDYTITLDKIQCGGANDSVALTFTLYNSFKRDFLPKGLTVSFYGGNPANANARLLQPAFRLPAAMEQKQATFNTIIKSPDVDRVYAVVNDDGSTLPLKLPNTDLEEKNYSNNSASIPYSLIEVTVTNSGPVCELDSISLMADASKPDATYEWTGPKGFRSSLQNPVLERVDSAEAGVYSVTASKNGCTSSPASTTVVITSHPGITVEAKNPVCESSTLNLFAKGNASTYKWTGPNGFTSTKQNPVIPNVSQSASGSYSVIATSGNNCSSPPMEVLVKVHPVPELQFTGPDICLPSTTATFNNQSRISEGNIISWLWGFGDPASDSANISTSKNPTHTFSGPGKYMISLTGYSAAGCSATIGQLYSGIHRQPAADFTSNKPQGACVNEPVIFRDNSIADGGTISRWSWETGDGTAPVIQNNAPAPVTHTYSSAGTYSVSLTVTNDFGCENKTTLPLTVLPPPVVNAGPDLLVLEGGSVTLRATASGTGLNYLWKPPFYLSSTTVLNPTVDNMMDDAYYVLTATDQYGCSASDQVVVKLLRKINIPNAFSPNGDGINDVWNIRYLDDYPGCTVEIFDRYGKLVFKSVGYNKPWDGTRNGTPAPVGVYYFIITPNNGVDRINGSVTLLR